MRIDLTDLSLEELFDLQADLTKAIRDRTARETCPQEPIPEVIRVGMQRYRASVASVSPRARKQTVLTDYRRCFLGISLGSPNSEGAKFEACVRWIAENFDECALVVADGIYHHTLQVTDEIALEQGRAQALQVGREFIARHEQFVASLHDQCRFEWYPASRVMDKPPYRGYLAEFHQLYERDDAYRVLVDDFVDRYLGILLKRRGPSFGKTLACKRQCVQDYLIEECAVMTVLSQEGWRLHLYPGSIKAFEALCEGRITRVPDAFKQLTFVAIRLTRGGLYFADSDEHTYAASGPGEEAIGQGVLADLDESDWRRFMSYTSRQRYLSGDVVMSAGDTERNLYILLSGTLEVLIGDWERDNKVRQVAIRGPGSVLGDQSFIDGQPRSATVAALGDCEVLVLAPKQFKRMQNKDPGLATALLHDISRVLSLRIRWGT